MISGGTLDDGYQSKRKKNSFSKFAFPGNYNHSNPEIRNPEIGNPTMVNVPRK